MATFGYTTPGASSEYIAASGAGALFTSPSDCGTLTKLSARVNLDYGAGADVYLGLYKHSDLSLVAGSAAVAIVPGWQWAEAVFNVALAPNTDYVIMCLGGGGAVDIYLAYDAGDANQGHLTTWFGSLQDPLVVSAHNANKYSVYATYTPTEPPPAGGVDSMHFGAD